MGSYAYKYARDRIPPYIMEDGKYEGDAGYDGDLYYAACDYIDELEDALKVLANGTGEEPNARLFNWLRNRPKSYYAAPGWDVKNETTSVR